MNAKIKTLNAQSVESKSTVKSQIECVALSKKTSLAQLNVMVGSQSIKLHGGDISSFI